ncbi:hypothetical protein INS49_013135 [Diaporthe citri]|uniref:uncharacterized protein n=1 Tax=Diaporthe citri TaxID=83186 RepID=UPI001C80B519|nr:uncharacterized protein INS49_013135 [Diaporthe citri]KAG6359613.1 hypothetical protein INS49_013135 [Diaporthe citri]
MPFTGSDICKIILAIFLPPLGVFFERGCGADLLINILLTILGYIPGIIHALTSAKANQTLLLQRVDDLTLPCAPRAAVGFRPSPAALNDPPSNNTATIFTKLYD